MQYYESIKVILMSQNRFENRMIGQVIKLFHPRGQMLSRCCLLLILGGITQLAAGQKVIKDASGQKIIQYDDGTWRYFEGRDSMLENNLWEEINFSASPTPLEIDSIPVIQTPIYDYQLFQKYIVAAVRYEAQMLDKVDQSSTNAHALEDQILASEATGDLVQADRLREGLKLLDLRRQDEQKLLSYARSLIKKILKVGKSGKYQRLAKIYVPGLNKEKELSEEDYQIAEAKTTLPDKSIIDNPATVNDTTVLSTNQESRQVDEEKGSEYTIPESLSPLPDSTKIIDQPAIDADTLVSEVAETETDLQIPADTFNLKQDRELTEHVPATDEQADEQIESQELTKIPVSDSMPVPADSLLYGEINMQSLPPASEDSIAMTSQSPSVEREQQTPDNAANVKVESMRAKPVFTANPGEKWFSTSTEKVPEYKCEFTFHGIDEFTNTPKKELREELFFSFTDARLKPYLKDRDYINCKGYLSSIAGGFRYLTLIYTIASKNANREYGYIKNGSLLNLKLLDGATVSLFTQSEIQGLLDPKTGDTVYKVRYPIDYQKEKILARSGIDRVRVVWSSGYEDYEVFNIDFFANQLKCLNSK